MRIDELNLINFRKFEKLSLKLHPQFTLLVGDNGSGKTCVLDALAVAIGIWLDNISDSSLAGSRREILRTDIRLEPRYSGDRIQFVEQNPAQVQAAGFIADGKRTVWLSQFNVRESVTRDLPKTGQEGASAQIQRMYIRDRKGEQVLFPVIAYYGAGRAWLPSKELVPTGNSNGAARRWAAYYECLGERIRLDALLQWFRNELIAKGAFGQFRPGFDAVCSAIIGCIPDSNKVWFDPDQDDIVVDIKGSAQPFRNLSAGQKVMLALVGDIAIKAVTQNAFLLNGDSDHDGPSEFGSNANNGSIGTKWEGIDDGSRSGHSAGTYRVLTETPGLVLIDEIDVHLHPKWQRRVIQDLRKIFPAIQFVATTHSPQVIGELSSENIVLMRQDGTWSHPTIGTKGTLAGEILQYVMSASAQDLEADRLEREINEAIDRDDLADAEVKYAAYLSATEEPTVQRMRITALIENERLLAER